MTEKLMIGEIQLCYFTFCEATRTSKWTKIQKELNKGFQELFSPPEYKPKDVWWSVNNAAESFDATTSCRANINTVDRMHMRWQIKIFRYPEHFELWNMTRFIKYHCNPAGSYLLERVALEEIV